MIVGDEASRAAAAEAGLPWIRGGLVEHSGGGLPIMEAKHMPWGEHHPEIMANSPIRRGLWAFIMQGEDLPYATNRVDLDPVIKDARGFPVARVTYKPGKHELVASDHYSPRLIAILEEMGAQWTAGSTSPGTGNASLPSAIPESRHNMGTVRMGSDPATSVVDPSGRLHQAENVVIADSSVFVTSAGYGPTLTLAALAARASHLLL
jgi:gluconate 2-dehydrogenase alpha chain